MRIGYEWIMCPCGDPTHKFTEWNLFIYHLSNCKQLFKLSQLSNGQVEVLVCPKSCLHLELKSKNATPSDLFSNCKHSFYGLSNRQGTINIGPQKMACFLKLLHPLVQIYEQRRLDCKQTKIHEDIDQKQISVSSQSQPDNIGVWGIASLELENKNNSENRGRTSQNMYGNYFEEMGMLDNKEEYHFYNDFESERKKYLDEQELKEKVQNGRRVRFMKQTQTILFHFHKKGYAQIQQKNCSAQILEEGTVRINERIIDIEEILSNQSRYIMSLYLSQHNSIQIQKELLFSRSINNSNYQFVRLGNQMAILALSAEQGNRKQSTLQEEQYQYNKIFNLIAVNEQEYIILSQDSQNESSQLKFKQSTCSQIVFKSISNQNNTLDDSNKGQEKCEIEMPNNQMQLLQLDTKLKYLSKGKDKENVLNDVEVVDQSNKCKKTIFKSCKHQFQLVSYYNKKQDIIQGRQNVYINQYYKLKQQLQQQQTINTNIKQQISRIIQFRNKLSNHSTIQKIR